MVDFEGFIPIYNGEVTANVDISLENSGWPGVAEAEHAGTVVAASLAMHADAGHANAGHTLPGIASADHARTVVALALHAGRHKQGGAAAKAAHAGTPGARAAD